MKDITVDADKFDAVLRRMVNMKPMTVKELSAKLKAEREAKKAPKPVQKMDKPSSRG
jgi:response regulator RpfG family c-di-GMP phosphodiesterase